MKKIRRAARRHFSAEDKIRIVWGDTAQAVTLGEVKNLRREASALKEVVAGLTLEDRLLKKARRRMGGRRRMRYPACEKLEIIQLVERSHLPVRRTLVNRGIPRATFYGMICIASAGPMP